MPRPATIQVLDASGMIVKILLLDVVKQESHQISNAITSHPVEQGSPISDHMRQQPDGLTLDCVISNDPLDRVGSPKDASDSYLELCQLGKGTLCRITTSLRVYENMALVNCTPTRNAQNSNALIYTATWQQIRIVENRLTTIVKSKDKNAQGKTQTGAQNTPPADDRSTGAKLADGIAAAAKMAFGGAP